MPKKNKGAQEGRPAAPEGASWDTHEAIWNAKSLQRVVENLERTRSESPESDPLLFSGTILAGPIFLSLATELALKALLCLAACRTFSVSPLFSTRALFIPKL